MILFLKIFFFIFILNFLGSVNVFIYDEEYIVGYNVVFLLVVTLFYLKIPNLSKYLNYKNNYLLGWFLTSFLKLKLAIFQSNFGWQNPFLHGFSFLFKNKVRFFSDIWVFKKYKISLNISDFDLTKLYISNLHFINILKKFLIFFFSLYKPSQITNILKNNLYIYKLL